MNPDDIYRLVTQLLPDPVMLAVYLIAAVRYYRLWRQGGRVLFIPKNVLPILVFPLIGITLYYAWATFAGPQPLPRLSGARVIFFGLGLAIIVLSLYVTSDKENDGD